MPAPLKYSQLKIASAVQAAKYPKILGQPNAEIG